MEKSETPLSLTEAEILVNRIYDYNLEQAKAGKGIDTYLVPMLWSTPGIGKTTVIKNIAKTRKVECELMIIAQYDPSDLGGFPYPDTADNVMRRMPIGRLPFTNSKEHGDEGILFLDELPQSVMMNQNLVAQLVNEGRIGEHRIKPGWTIVAAGNPPSSKAGTSPMPAHLRDRLMHIYIKLDSDSWFKWAMNNGIDASIIAYLRKNEVSLNRFDDPNAVNPTPRSWEKVSTVMSLNLPSMIRRAAIAGQIGDGEAHTFEKFYEYAHLIPDVNQIFADPENGPIVKNQPDIMFMLMANIATKVSIDTLGAAGRYLARLDLETALVAMRDIAHRSELMKEYSHLTRTKDESIRDFQVLVNAVAKSGKIMDF